MKLLKVAVLCLIFLGGILLGFFVKNFPFVRWNNEVKIYEVFQVCSTLFIGIALPFFIKKWIDDGRVIKTLLVDEAKELIHDVKSIKQKMIACHEKGEITAEEKQQILSMFSQVENVLVNYRNNVWNQFGKKIETDYIILKDAYFNYSKAITSDDFMIDDFKKIDLNFLNFHHIEYDTFISHIRAFSVKIQKI